MALVPKMNQWWNVPLYVTTRGLTTSPMPYRDRTLSIDFDFIDHQLLIRDSAGKTRSLPLVPPSVADFLSRALRRARRAPTFTSRYPSRCRRSAPVTTLYCDGRRALQLRREPRAAIVGRCSGASSRCFRPSARAFAASAARCTCSGAASTSRSRASTGAARRCATGRGRIATPTTRRSSSVWLLARRSVDPAPPKQCSTRTPWPGAGGIRATNAFGPRPRFFSDTFKEFVLPYAEVRRAPDPAQAILEFAEEHLRTPGSTLAAWDIVRRWPIPSLEPNVDGVNPRQLRVAGESRDNGDGRYP